MSTRQMTTASSELREKIENKTATVGIVGMGYVGLPLAVAVFDAGFPVIGFDVDEKKIEHLNNGTPYLKHLGSNFAQDFVDSERFSGTTDAAELVNADIISLCVPTPLGSHNEPDLTYVLDSTREVAKILRRGQLVVLESTTYPGTTRDEMLPILEESGLKHGEDFFLAYSPEREDPGRKSETTQSIPKLVGGIDESSGSLAHAFYSAVVDNAHLVSSAEVAESAKLLENIYRAVNIALVNEMKLILDKLGIDIWEVVDAAATKPFGFMKFTPGPGLGGHCIPIDPHYLSWKLKALDYNARFIQLAGEINTAMPLHVVGLVQEGLNQQRKSIRGSQILVIGVAYKKNVDDVRESPALDVMKLLENDGAELSFYDPYVSFVKLNGNGINGHKSLTEENLKNSDAVIIMTDHDQIDFQFIEENSDLIIDSRNVIKKDLPHVIKLGVGKN